MTDSRRDNGSRIRKAQFGPLEIVKEIKGPADSDGKIQPAGRQGVGNPAQRRLAPPTSGTRGTAAVVRGMPIKYINPMKTTEIYEYLERISNLLRTDIRKGGISLGLQPVQLEALNYLFRCNRYSNSPVAVAEFLGLTKGTVSQTLAVLENSGLIEKHPDQKDRRVIHLELTEAGRRIVAECIPPKVLRQAVGEVDPAGQEMLLESLRSMLSALQHANRLRSFGVCKNCRHHALRPDGSRHCRLTGEDLSELDSDKICREHEAPPAVPVAGG